MERTRPFYEGAVYRPPVEANSLIVQVTLGCSHNACTFCSMYRGEKFRIKPLHHVLEDFEFARKQIRYIPSVFLADGDALIRKTSDLLTILDYIRKNIPECERVTCYASPNSVLIKTPEELRQLRDAGLTRLYFGFESGDDEVLRRTNKGVNAEQMLESCLRVMDSGLQLSCLMIVGLGGMELWEQHAINTGKMLSIIKPRAIGANMLMLSEPSPMRDQMLRGEFTLPGPMDMLRESKLLLENLDCEGTKYVGTHVSNYVPLDGVLNRDKELFIQRIDRALRGEIRLQPEWMRRS